MFIPIYVDAYSGYRANDPQQFCVDEEVSMKLRLSRINGAHPRQSSLRSDRQKVRSTSFDTTSGQMSGPYRADLTEMRFSPDRQSN